jgi:hypothetical protein
MASAAIEAGDEWLDALDLGCVPPDAPALRAARRVRGAAAAQRALSALKRG